MRPLLAALCGAVPAEGRAAVLGPLFADTRPVAARLAGFAAAFFFAGFAADFAAVFAAGLALTLAAAAALTPVLRAPLRVLAVAEAVLVFAEGLALRAGRFAAGM